MKNKTKRCVKKQSIGECPSKSVLVCACVCVKKTKQMHLNLWSAGHVLRNTKRFPHEPTQAHIVSGEEADLW